MNKKSDFEFRGCLVCKYGHFADPNQIFGECRFNPPRAIIDKNNTATGRMFTHVKFDDWCGKLISNGNSISEKQFKELLPYTSDDNLRLELMYKDAKTKFANGDYIPALELLEPLYHAGKVKNTMVERVIKTLRELTNVLPVDEDLKIRLETWQHRSATLENSEARNP